MKRIIYYVATSLDGYIAGEGEDISGFLQEGNGIEKYKDDLKDFQTVIMGKATYEFGYKFGMPVGAAPYPHMNHFIFSNSLVLENAANNVFIKNIDLAAVDKVKDESKTDVYLCGGGIFAGWLLDNERIDILKLKVNPFVLGKGVKLFGPSKKEVQLNLIESEKYDGGLMMNSYEIKY